jgi:aspartyl aminopeptidase
MSHIVYLSNECFHVKTKQHVMLNLQNKICKIEIPSKNEYIYFKFISETPTTFSGIRIQQDQYNNNKFYVTDEKNKWHGIITDGSFTKGRWIYVYKS